MLRRGLFALVIGTVAAAPLSAWGFDAHKFISERAIEVLPPALKPFYDRHRPFIVEHTIDPDLWRTAGFEEEPPRHFLDLDAYGPYPFSDLPREYGAALQKFGPEELTRNGLLPWRVEEMYGRLVRAFQQAAKRSFGTTDITYFSAILSHYVGDGHVPLHAVLNYDGQLTKQRGVHARFESDLFTRYRAKLSIAPTARPTVTAPREFMFETLLASFPLADVVLKADRDASGSEPDYGDRYFDRFFAAAGPTLEARVNESIRSVAAVWIGAWEAAGSPDLVTERPPAPRTKR
jgi:hypothetical protein